MNMQVTNLDAASLLNTDLNDLVDLPGFSVPEPGYYKLSVSAEVKDVNGKASVVLDYEVQEILEMASPDADPPTIGDKFGELFSLDNEFGVGKLKQSLAPYSETFGTNLGGIIEQLKGVQIYATVKRRKDKNDGTKFYAMVSGATLC